MNITSIIFTFNLFVFLCVSFIQGNDDKQIDEDRAPEMLPRHPLIVLKRKDGYVVPSDVEISGNRRIFKNNDSTEVKFFCPYDESEIFTESNVVSQEDLFTVNYCLVETKLEAVIRPGCLVKEVEPSVRLIENTISSSPDRKYRCGPDGNGNLFEFYFTLCELAYNDHINQQPTTSSTFPSFPSFPLNLLHVGKRKKDGRETFLKKNYISMHRFCYDREKTTIIYTWHEILAPWVLQNVSYLGELSVYESNTKSTNGYGMFDFDFKKIAKQFKDSGLGLHMMVPPNDMAFGLWKKVTYHYSNVKPMPEELSSLWGFIDEHIREKAIVDDVQYQIFMGEFVVIREGSDEPEKIWSKILYDHETKAGLVIIMHYEEVEDDTRPHCYKRPFEIPPCNIESWNGHENFNTKLAYCCEIKNEHTELFGIKLEIKNGFYLE